MRLVAVNYQQRRLEYFKDQLAAAKRRLKWGIDHNRNWMELEDNGEIVSYYEWAAQMAEKDVVFCKDCKHYLITDKFEGGKRYMCKVTHFSYIDSDGDMRYCSYGERKDGADAER